jgi:antitoxin VapB
MVRPRFSAYAATFWNSAEPTGISIKNPEAERKLRRVARLLGKSLTATVIELADDKLKKDRERRLRAVDRIIRRVNSRPVLDNRTPDEILGYNKDGLFDGSRRRHSCAALPEMSVTRPPPPAPAP